MPRFEWDEAKRAANRAKHGVDFADIAEMDWDRAVKRVDPRFAEPRFQAVGPIRGRLHLVGYTLRSGHIRIITMRKANDREIRRLAE